MLALAALASGAGRPRCFGAAAADAAHPCRNPALARSVVPAPADALIETDYPCALMRATIEACSFGVPSSRARRTVALLGDSHAAHWRAAIAVAAARLRWHVISVTRNSCSYTLAVQIRPEGTLDAGCVQFNRKLIKWLNGRPEISAVLMSDHPGPVVRRPGQSSMDAHVEGILAGWRALPANIRHIVAIRDDPFATDASLACVSDAIDRRAADPGRRCALPARALHPDPDLVAAARARAARIQVADLSSFFCDRRRCPPVIGGVLVYRDGLAHLTREYATSLGPYLADRLGELPAGWAAAVAGA